MKLALGLCACAALVVINLFSKNVDSSMANSPPPVHESVISSTPCDVDADGIAEVVEIAIVNGRLWYRDWFSCESGAIWEGSFEVRVVASDGVLSSASLNELMGRDSLYFWWPCFKLKMGDYNGDGLVDFNLFSTYGQCNGENYRLFTIDRAGKVSCLGTEEFYAGTPHTDSTSYIVGEGGLLGVCCYSQDEGAYVTTWYNRAEKSQLLGVCFYSPMLRTYVTDWYAGAERGWTRVFAKELGILDNPWCPCRAPGLE